MEIAAVRWRRVRSLFDRAFATSFHFAIATVDEDGSPRVTPIGSLLLTEPGRAIYFERFTRGIPRNAVRDGRVTVLAVDAGATRWLRALAVGRFASPPAVRLRGRFVGPARDATSDELRRWRRRVRIVRFLPGYAKLWGELRTVREIAVEAIEPVRLGAMTDGRF